jgi:diaminopimelate epimerase
MSPDIAFEKWQALGNDYLIFEERALTLELTPARITRLCDVHTGIGSDGILQLSEPVEEDEGAVARLRIFNPDGSEAELSGNGAREAAMYLRRAGWTDADEFTIRTVAGTVRVRITGPTTCALDMGKAHTSSPDYPSGSSDGFGMLKAAGRGWRFQHVSIGNPQCAIRVAGVDELEALDLPAVGPAIERHAMFPHRTNVSWFCELEPGVIRARVFERGVGETMSSGTGATGAAIGYVLRGGKSPVRVRLDGGELDVEISRDLRVTLSGPAVPVFRGELADDFRAELEAA